MNWDAEPSRKRGRSRTFRGAAIQTCLAMKVLFGMALEQTTGFVESMPWLTERNWDVPDFSTSPRLQKTLAANIPHRGSKGPRHLRIDSTGIKFEGEVEWSPRQHGGPKRCVWRKIHIGIDEQKRDVRAVEIIGSVTTDGAYSTRRCHNAIADRGAFAVLPPRRNAQPCKPTTAGAIARNGARRTSKYLGRAL